jgi:fatty-acyl-CoA synthase
MAALFLKAGCHFEPQSFYEHVTKALPAYAAPVFIRLLGEASVTATFKLKKTDLVRDGIDPRSTQDLIFFRDDRQRTFEPFDEDAFLRVQRGELKV